MKNNRLYIKCTGSLSSSAYATQSLVSLLVKKLDRAIRIVESRDNQHGNIIKAFYIDCEGKKHKI